MSISYEKFVDNIMNMRRFGKKKGVEVSGELLDALNHPERGMRIIHVAGTNGKGSTCVFIANMLMKMGFKVGLFTSPHLIDYNERIQIGENNTFTRISHEDVIRLGQVILEHGADLTMFDVCFVMACLKFKEESCDYVILETGLGGKYDSTTAISEVPKACAITSIGLDHTKYLGDTIEEIADNKAGIIVGGTKVVLSEMPDEAMKVMYDRCNKLRIADRDIIVTTNQEYLPYTYLKTLKGFQRINAKTAISTVQVLIEADKDLYITKYMDFCHSSEEHCSNDCAKCADADKSCSVGFDEWVDLCINMGLNSFKWSGRLEWLSDNILIDGAHNEEAFTALSEYLRSEYSSYEVYFIVAVLNDKDYFKEFKIIEPIADTYLTADIDDKRSKSGRELMYELQNEGYNAKYIGSEEDVANYIHNLIKKNNANSDAKLYNRLYVITGSLYFVGNVKRYLCQLQQE